MRTANLFVLILLAVASTDLAEGHGEGISLHPPQEMKWQQGPPSLPKGAQITVLEGDPSKEGRLCSG